MGSLACETALPSLAFIEMTDRRVSCRVRQQIGVQTGALMTGFMPGFTARVPELARNAKGESIDDPIPS